MNVNLATLRSTKFMNYRPLPKGIVAYSIRIRYSHISNIKFNIDVLLHFYTFEVRSLYNSFHDIHIYFVTLQSKSDVNYTIQHVSERKQKTTER